MLLGLTGNAQINLGLYFNPTRDFVINDAHRFNYSAGVKSDISVYRNFSIKAGLGYEHIYSDFSHIIYFAPGNEFVYYKTDIIKTDCHIKFDFLNKSKGFSFYVFGGPTFNTSFHEWKGAKFSNITIESYKCRLSNVLIVGGLGYGWTVKNIIFIHIEPTYAKTVWNNKNIWPFLGNRVGLNVGLSYKFMKEDK